MTKQTFTTGQVLTAAQMTSLQATAMGGGSPIVKTTSYVLVADDAGTVIQMNSATATTITVNTALFAAGDSVQIQNIGAGICTITAGTATVTTAGSLALSQWEGGNLYFTSTSAAIFFDIVQSTGMTNPMTTTGDTIYSSSGSTPARLGVGTAGQVLTVNAGATAPEWKTASTGSITWSQRAYFNRGMSAIAYNGTNLYVAVGVGGFLTTSPDGITWTTRTSGFGSNDIQSVAYGNSLWVAVGFNGTITTSTDGITWTARTSNMSTNAINSVVYANSLWVAVGQGGGATNTGGIAYSSDGITWTRKSQTPATGTTYYAVVWNGTNWIVGGLLSTNNYLYASTPSGTWTVGAFAGSDHIYNIWWDGTRQIVNVAGSMYYSTSTTMASGTAYANGILITGTYGQNNYYYNNSVYANGAFFTGYSSTPNTGNLAQRNVFTVSPASSNTTTGTFTFNGPGCLFIGSVGYIVADSSGSFYTSF